MKALTDYKQALTGHWPLINSIAGRRFADDTLAEEAALYVLNRLEEDDYRRLRAFSGRAKFSTYLSSLCIRLLEDFSRKKYGRFRPPAWITALGGIWLFLFQLLCMQRLGVVDAVETVMSKAPHDRSSEEVEDAAWKILERIVHCGSHQGQEVSMEDRHDERLHPDESVRTKRSSPEKQLLEQERRIFFEMLFNTNIEQETGCASGRFAWLKNISLNLEGEERLLLKLCFQDDLTVTRAGEMLGLNTNQVHGKLRRLLIRLRNDFDRAGISDELRQLLHI